MADIVERLQVHAGIMTRDKGKWVRFIDGADGLTWAERKARKDLAA